MPESNRPKPSDANRKLTVKLVCAVIAMFGFGYALVPLYDVMCDALGINGKTNTIAMPQPHGLTPDLSRTIDVELMAHVPPSIHWNFRPKSARISVHPGQMVQTAYLATNLSDRDLIAQAVPSVSPGLAANHFNKVECFCFTKQPLGAGESAELGLIFYIEPDIAPNIQTVTLSYTIYDISNTVIESDALAMVTPHRDPKEIE